MIEMPKRKYDDNYLDYGFAFLERHNEQLPQCVICHKTLSNDSMKPHPLEAPLQCTPRVRWQGEAVFLIEGKLLEKNEDGPGRKISN